MSQKTFRTGLFVLIIAFGVFVNIPMGKSLTLMELKGPYRYGGTFRVPMDADLTTLNPLVSFKGVDHYASILLYPKLLTNDPDWRFDAPYLAYSYNVSDDGKTYTFNLYDNATWTDGVPLTSEDVKFSIEYYKNYSIPVPTPHVHNIQSVETPDPYTVVMHLENASATWITVDLWRGIYIVPKHIWEDVEDPLHFANDDPVGAGPFKLSKWVKGQYLEFVANDDFWLGRPYLDKVLLVVILTHDATVMAYKQGSIDMVGIYGNEVPAFLTLPNTTIYQTVDPGLTVLGINNLKTPGNDVNFRRAIAHTVDKERICETMYYSYATPNDNFLTIPYNASGNWLNPDVRKYPYNLTLAAKLLDEAGYVDADGDGKRDLPNGTKLKLTIETTGNLPTWIRAAEMIVEDWKTIDFDAEVISVDLGQQITDMCTTKNYQFTYYRCGPASGDPAEMLGWFTEDEIVGGLNTAAWVNETFETLQALEKVEPDETERREMVLQMQVILTEEMPNVPTVQGTGLRAIRTTEFEGFINCLPYGPVSNMDIYNYLSIHLKGSPSATESIVTLTMPSTAEIGDVVTLTGKLTDVSGTSIAGEYVDFFVGGTIIGSFSTDSNGIATLQYTPTDEGTIEVKGAYRGGVKYAKSESDIETLTVGAPAPPPPPPPNYTPYYIAAAIVLIVIVVAYYAVKKKP